ncbi:hypothetical protein CH322_04660 [Mycoplasmopsis bovis]|nr:hypothetical protein CH322_04660 [Mycoplasmopsis bovis]
MSLQLNQAVQLNQANQQPDLQSPIYFRRRQKSSRSGKERANEESGAKKNTKNKILNSNKKFKKLVGFMHKLLFFCVF